MYSNSEADYSKYYTELCNESPPNVVDYYNSNWHDIRQDWVKCHVYESDFMNMTNSRTESFYQKLKLFIEMYSFLTEFLEDLFRFLKNIHQHRRNNKATNVFLKVPLFSLTDPEKKYFFFLDELRVQLCSQGNQENEVC